MTDLYLHDARSNEHKTYRSKSSTISLRHGVAPKMALVSDTSSLGSTDNPDAAAEHTRRFLPPLSKKDRAVSESTIIAFFGVLRKSPDADNPACFCSFAVRSHRTRKGEGLRMSCVLQLHECQVFHRDKSAPGNIEYVVMNALVPRGKCHCRGDEGSSSHSDLRKRRV